MEMGPQRHGNCPIHIYKKLLEINLVESRICSNNCCSIRSISMLAEWQTSDAPKNTNPFHGGALPLDYVSAVAAVVPWLDNTHHHFGAIPRPNRQKICFGRRCVPIYCLYILVNVIHSNNANALIRLHRSQEPPLPPILSPLPRVDCLHRRSVGPLVSARPTPFLTSTAHFICSTHCKQLWIRCVLQALRIPNYTHISASTMRPWQQSRGQLQICSTNIVCVLAES